MTNDANAPTSATKAMFFLPLFIHFYARRRCNAIIATKDIFKTVWAITPSNLNDTGKLEGRTSVASFMSFMKRSNVYSPGVSDFAVNSMYNHLYIYKRHSRQKTLEFIPMNEKHIILYQKYINLDH